MNFFILCCFNSRRSENSTVGYPPIFGLENNGLMIAYIDGNEWRTNVKQKYFVVESKKVQLQKTKNPGFSKNVA